MNYPLHPLQDYLCCQFVFYFGLDAGEPFLGAILKLYKEYLFVAYSQGELPTDYSSNEFLTTSLMRTLIYYG